MAESRSGGRALRIYQIAGLLVAGWMVGRLPDLATATSTEASRLREAIGITQPPATPAERSPEIDQSQLTSRIAAEVAGETVARLIAAGWGPRQVQPIVVPAAQREIVYREAPAPTLGTPAPDNVAGWTLPPTPYAGVSPRDVPDSQPVNLPPPANARPTDVAAHAVAARGYDALKDGRRKEAADLLSAAVRMAPESSQSAAWSRDLRALTQRWSVSAYSLARGAGRGDALAASPVLGASQAGGTVVYTLDPLAKRPISAFARMAVAADPLGNIDSETGEIAIGARIQPLPGVPIAVDIERRIAMGIYGRQAWAARIAGGTAFSASVANLPLNVESWAEAGIVGIRDPDFYGGVQARAATPLFDLGGLSIDGGAGVWAAGQRSYGNNISRLDLGPSVRFRVARWPVSAQMDYRVQAAGNAYPGSGPALTVAAQF